MARPARASAKAGPGLAGPDPSTMVGKGPAACANF